MICGLLGRKLGHSYSPQIHRYLGNYSYELFEKEPDELEYFLKNGPFSGLNVTIPYKKVVLPYCDQLSPTAEKLGAVNTIVRTTDNRIIGHNTDYFGFKSMVQKSGLIVSGKKVLILGSGGASLTAQAVMSELNANVIVVSRSGIHNYTNLHNHANASVIVNCTPVGMYPNTGSSPVNLSVFPNLEGVLDMIYNPARTKLLMDAEDKGLVAMNGLWMLVAQAKESAEWFLGRHLDDNLMDVVYKNLKCQMQNFVLIGMPGSGKSTIAKLLGNKLNRTVVDADIEIVASTGRSIPDIFANDGENAFREIETEVLSELGKKSKLILATGGGCVTRDANYPLLHQNGIIIWIKRDLSKLPTAGRPLSATIGANKLFAVRKPLYERFADFSVSNDGTPQDAVLEIIKQLEI